MKKKVIENRINSEGNVWCYLCEDYVQPDKIKFSKNQYESYCRKCRAQYEKDRIAKRKLESNAKPGQTEDGWDKNWWRIWTDEDTPDNVNFVLSTMGYDTTKNIHQQFMEKYADKLDKSKR